MRPCSMSASSRVVFAATCTPALRSSFVAFWEVAVPNTRPGPPARPRPARRPRARGSCRCPPGPTITSTVRLEVSTWYTAAAWSSRRPRCVTCSRASCARSRSCASSSAASAPSRCAACSRGRCGAPCVWACATSRSSADSCAAVA